MPVERLGGVLPGGQHADVVDDDEVAPGDPGRWPGRWCRRRLARPMAAVRVSRVNQATRIPASMAWCASASAKCDLPVPGVIHGLSA